jgi:hypothetical protein
VVRCQKVRAAFALGAAHRATATTHMNAHSSRSHAVLTLRVEQELPAAAVDAAPERQTADATAVSSTAAARPLRRRRVVRSKFHLVDLAGRQEIIYTPKERERGGGERPRFSRPASARVCPCCRGSAPAPPPSSL